MSNNLYLQIRGGLGKNISFTGVAKYLKESNLFDQIYVMSPYYDVFEACSYVDGVYKPNEVRDFIFDAKNDEGSKLVNDNMYETQEFIFKQEGYAEAWCKLLDVEPLDLNGYTVALDAIESKFPNCIRDKDRIIKAIKDKGFEDFVIMQFTGGQTPLVQVPVGIRKNANGQDENFADWSKVPYNYDNEPLKRHYPKEKAQQFVELFEAAHPKTAIIMYQLPNEPCPDRPNVVRATVPYLVYNLLAKEATGIVTIDSSLQHLTAGLTKTVVIWGHSLPEHFGYVYNENVIQDCRRDDICYFTALGPSGARVHYIEPKDLLKAVNGYIYGPSDDKHKIDE